MQSYYLLVWMPIICLTLAVEDSNTRYAVIIDAGSSGSRAHVFRWQESPSDLLPDFEAIKKTEVRPGISSYVNKPEELKASIVTLIMGSQEAVPADLQGTTPIYLKATGGMRLLSEADSNNIINTINVFLLDKSISPFDYTDGDCSVLSGEEEGVFAWITVNYLDNFFTRDDTNKRSSGILELGGASMQIAFQHDGSILAGKISQEIGSNYYNIYTHSYLSYGQDQLLAGIRRQLRRSAGESSNNVNNPCMIKDDVVTVVISGQNVTFTGTGDPTSCLEVLDEFLTNSVRCSPRPCAIDGVYQPSFAPSEKFYALSAFYYTATYLGAVHSDGVTVPDELRLKAAEYCTRTTLADLEDYRTRTSRTTNYCMIGLYIPTLLTDGLHFPRNTTQVITASTINGKEPDWPLGAMIYEYERQRSTCPTETMANKIKRSKAKRGLKKRNRML